MHNLESNMFFEYIPGIQLPKELIDNCFYNVSNTPNLFKQGKHEVSFSCFKIPNDVLKWIKDNYPFVRNINPNLCRIQTLGYDIPIHCDRNRKKAFNYIIQEGGENVLTAWYDEHDIQLAQVEIKKHSWHIIDTQTRHGVHGISKDEKRIALSIDLID